MQTQARSFVGDYDDDTFPGCDLPLDPELVLVIKGEEPVGIPIDFSNTPKRQTREQQLSEGLRKLDWAGFRLRHLS